MAFRIDRVTAANTSSARRFFGPVWAAAAALALTLGAMPASAQDVPWGKKPATKKPAKKPTAKKPTAKKPVDQKKLAEQKKLAAQRKAAHQKKLAEQRKRAAERLAAHKKRLAQKKLEAKKRLEAQRAAVAKKLAEKKALAAQKKLAEQGKAVEAKAVEAKAVEGSDKAPATPPKLTDQMLLDHFHKTLEPHGSWQKDSTFGQVWVPSEKEVGKSFSPYRTDGRWALTKNGSWAWASDHKWGNIPFHYGRWVKTKDKRHAWIPGTEYAPAWVVWRTADDARQFVGWAPMAPMHHWMNTSATQQWNFVPTRNLFGPKVDNFVIRDPQMAATMMSQSRILGSHSDAQGVRSGVIKAASPTLRQGNVPFYAAPKVKMDLNEQAIAPITAEIIQLANAPKPKAVKEAAEESPEPVEEPEVASSESEQNSRFATPPPPDDDEDEAEVSSFREFKRRARRSRRSMRARRALRRARIRRAARANRRGRRHRLPVYRCGWTNSRPRKWRCGPATMAPRRR